MLAAFFKYIQLCVHFNVPSGKTRHFLDDSYQNVEMPITKSYINESKYSCDHTGIGAISIEILFVNGSVL
jgi:hypothetical protein